MSDKVIRNNDFVFTLDIGTRSIVGMLGKKEENKINIEYTAVEFHSKRAMYNGQIHDIDSVVEAVRKVKDSLEKESKSTLKDVSIAAAGRSLETRKVTVERAIDPSKNIDKDMISSLEIEGLQKAQNELEKDFENNAKYFCVGHTIMHYYIDDGFITNPLGHKANKIKIDILATFLPQIVIDSLYFVTSKLNLEIRYMTLEPIAAIEVAIPENARLLNLSLVDIGAGTSDIAITKEGTIVAYGMISKAGDYITEEISKQYLLDFDTAEQLKVNLCKQKVQRFSDIVGLVHEIHTEDILKQIEPAIKELAKLISSNIKDHNGDSPSAVFLIGGGSQIPNLNIFIAEELGIPKERVAVRGLEIVKDTISISDSITGPEYITPIGILTKSINSIDLDFIEIHINDRNFKLFKTKELKVKDALVLADVNPRSLIPKRGKSANITINEKEKVLYGEYGEPAQIYINGQISSIESNIKNGDVIKIIPSKEGKEADYTVESLCKYLEISYLDYIIKVNEKTAELDSRIANNDKINIEKKNSLDVPEQLYKEEEEIVENVCQNRNSNEVELDESKTLMVKCNGETVKIPKKDREVIFVDIFDFIDFDRSKVKGKLMLVLNGKDAKYTDLLKDGDEIKIYWAN